MTFMATIKLICQCGVSETKHPIFPVIHMRMLPILTDFMAYLALQIKPKNPPTTEKKELKLPGGDINHELSTHLK